MKKFSLSILLTFLIYNMLYAQDSVTVTFRHYPTRDNVVRAFVPGTFNNWGPNSNGQISSDAPSLMTDVDSLGFYVKSFKFQVGQTAQYKFHEHYDQSGSSWQWFTDPLNPRINVHDNNNSMLTIEKVMIFEISPKNETIINNSRPQLTAGVFSREDDPILLDQSTIYLDDVLLTTFEGYYLDELNLLSIQLPELANGIHKLTINLFTQQGESVKDSTSFTVIAGEIFFFTPSCDSVFAPVKTIRWRVNMESSTLNSGTLKQLDLYPLTFNPSPNTEFSQSVSLIHGWNRYLVSVTDDRGITTESDTLKLFYVPEQKPDPRIVFEQITDKMSMTAVANDPQGEQVNFIWSNQATNPFQIQGIDGAIDQTIEFDTPSVPGDYSFKLEVTDASGNINSTVNFFTVTPDSNIIIPSIKTVPQWVKDAQIYCIFFKAFTPAGIISSAIDSLHHIKNMGFDVVWVLPVMDVEGDIDQGANVGYNIIDFYNVDPNYGTNEDFKRFVNSAHELGLRVILDVTPNHSSRSHPIALDVRAKKKFSRYYEFFQHEEIAHNTNGLGQCVSRDGIVYYCGFSDALLNWNWSDAEARQYMIDVYTHWLREYDIDGFRFDVYWGPHRRYGRQDFDRPLRSALRAAKADIMLLAETHGTGAGTELIYADQNGGVDLGYDWSLKDAIWSYPSINNLNSRLYNSGYRPGENSFFLRFLENHDEDRVVYRYNSIEKTIPVSTAIFMATGIPLLYQGQEMGMGYGMSGSKDYRARATINWKNPPARVLAPHYHKLAQIRAQFPAFRRQFEDTNLDGSINSSDKNVQQRLNASSTAIYAFARPYPDQNGIVVMNFSNQSGEFEVDLNLDYWAEFSEIFSPEKRYYLNNLYQGTSEQRTGPELEKLNIYLNPYQVAVFSLSLNEEYLDLPAIFVDVQKQPVREKPDHYELFDNYPNPFNPTTIIEYRIAEASKTELTIYNIQGQKIRTLVNSGQNAGQYRVEWDGLTDQGVRAASGLYFYKLQAKDFVDCRKMLLLR